MMCCAHWIVPEGVALVSCENMQVGSDVREDGSAGATEPAGGGQIRTEAVIFAKGAPGPAGTLKDQAGPVGGGQIRPAPVIFAKGAAGPAGTLKDQAGPAVRHTVAAGVHLSSPGARLDDSSSRVTFRGGRREDVGH
ncbi:hypothetical protein F511_37504 [Dorcoceras hygrometricum]|uniref:Uncharacterized protein n=1 Tax=Dorcoceras hygrometricum TaxID=472368 RepID=A0A2Z7D3D4_9LAMI|nr:hypothetical protein F511_37504 [Dorcoceras hygrometricum]